MRFICVILLFLLSINIQAATVEYNAVNCQAETDDETNLLMSDLAWGQSLIDMDARFKSVYQSGKRLNNRAYVSKDGFVLPIKGSEEVVNISERFVSSVVSHIETALIRNHADYIFFSDMGHSHLFVDIDTYKNKVKHLKVNNTKARYEVILNDPKTKFLYHTAEQLKMTDENKVLLDDRKVQWRFFTRNIIGDNLVSNSLEVIHAHDNAFNTAGAQHYDANELKYRYWGGGYSISASSDGCFAYKHNGETLYFDISLYDVEYTNLSGT